MAYIAPTLAYAVPGPVPDVAAPLMCQSVSFPFTLREEDREKAKALLAKMPKAATGATHAPMTVSLADLEAAVAMLHPSRSGGEMANTPAIRPSFGAPEPCADVSYSFKIREEDSEKAQAMFAKMAEEEAGAADHRPPNVVGLADVKAAANMLRPAQRTTTELAKGPQHGLEKRHEQLWWPIFGILAFVGSVVTASAVPAMKFTTLTTAMTALALCSTTGVHAAPAKQRVADGQAIQDISSYPMVMDEIMFKTLASLRPLPFDLLESSEDRPADGRPPTLAKRGVNLEAETLNSVIRFIDQLPHRIAAAAASQNTTAAALVSDMHRGIDAAAAAEDATTTEAADVARLRGLIADAARATGATTDIIAEQIHEVVAGAGEEAVGLKAATTAGEPGIRSGMPRLFMLVTLMEDAKKGKLQVMKRDGDEDKEDDLLEKGGWPFGMAAQVMKRDDDEDKEDDLLEKGGWPFGMAAQAEQS
ncbi:hypothetical protein SLS58_005424 [Diplodia intermedia]|uniref:Uncharacterized protein n=1 Tax=Diplodia intermedia TaxID=856260 RepID=A0ABR3TQA9_9PEZI